MWVDDCLVFKHHCGGSGDGDGTATVLFYLSKKMRGLYWDGHEISFKTILEDFFLRASWYREIESKIYY